ncbi:hypothetical protein [Bremerella sp. P1]|uniref:hypothetical protein n=1 Tax=Bremerella sp. P1 TaxID=3026424 RepID=UPI0023682403|nr:hypothetical protein [Bremerella sp. P1]WDI41363.1 hypothetical protein PSR63_23115 [Bremerella sp. P1]
MKTLNTFTPLARPYSRKRTRPNVVHRVEQLEVRAMLAADVLGEVRVTSTELLGSSFADLSGLTTSFTLTEEATLRLESTLNLSTNSNSDFGGKVRFAINGTGETTVAEFSNPYVLPTLSGDTGDTSVLVDPPPAKTSESDAGTTHDHTVNVPAFSADAHSHSFSLAPQSSIRNWSVDARQWVTLGPGSYTITVQAEVDDAVLLDGLQKLTVTRFASGPVPDVSDIERYRTINHLLGSGFTEIGNVSQSVTLTEETSIYLNSNIKFLTSPNNSFSGEIRFTVDGVAEATAATFDNPFLLPSLSGITNTVSATVNPPLTTTSDAGIPSHNHAINIGNFSTTSHSHSVDVAPVDSDRKFNVNASDWITLGPGTYDLSLEIKANEDVSIDGFVSLTHAAFSPQAIPGLTYDEVDTTANGNVAATFADVPGLSSSFVLTEETLVSLNSQLSMATISNSNFAGQVRFAVNGNGEANSAIFGNPYQLPALTGTTSSETFSVDPPVVPTSKDGADAGHTHMVDIAEFQSNPHAHLVTVSPSTSRRTWNVDAVDWILLGPGSYTVTVQAQTNGTVVFDDEQSLDVVMIPTNSPPFPSIDSVSTLRFVANEITVDASATDANEASDQLEYQYRVYVDGEVTPSFEDSGTDMTQFKFTPTAAGSYRIELTVVDSLGAYGVVEQTISVEAASKLDLIFSKQPYVVGDVDPDGIPDEPDVFHEWEDARAHLWITIEGDLPQGTMDLWVVTTFPDSWFDDQPVVESVLTAGKGISRSGPSLGVLFYDLDLSGYQVGDRVLLATLLFLPDITDGVGIPISGNGAYEMPTTDHGVGLFLALDEKTNQAFPFTEQAAGEFVPVIYDADDNGQVGIGDFSQFVSQFGKVPSVANPDAYLFDFDRSGKVGLSDFTEFVRYFGLQKPSGTRVVEMPGLTTELPPAAKSLPLEGESVDSVDALITELPITPDDFVASSITGSFASRQTISYGPVESSEMDAPSLILELNLDPRLIDTLVACDYVSENEEDDELEDIEELLEFVE